MPEIKLRISVEIENYSEIALQNSGKLASFLEKVPLIGFFVRSKIDDAIMSEIRTSLDKEVSCALQGKLSERGVKCEVSGGYLR